MYDEQIKEDRFRNFFVILYKDSECYDYDDVIFNIKGFKYYAYIEHVPETDEKKSHVHVFIHLDNATTIKAIAKKIGVPMNYFQVVKNVRSSCRYLTHIDYPEKKQYSYDDVIVSNLFERKFKKQFEDIETEEDIINNIYGFIENIGSDTPYTYALRYLVLYVNKNCYDTVFRRYRVEFLNYLSAFTSQKNY